MSDRFSHASFVFGFLFAIGLLTALTLLAILQYRWIGDVSEAERQRLQNNVNVAASRFAEEFNGEVARTLIFLAMGQRFSLSDLRDDYGELYLQWTATTAYPQIVKNIFIVENPRNGKSSLLWFDLESKRLEPADWPSHLLDVKERLTLESPPGLLDSSLQGLPGSLFPSREPPTAVMPLAVFGRRLDVPRFPPNVPLPPGPPRPEGWVIVEFNLECIVNEVFPNLVQRYFSALGETEYRIAVTTRSQPRQIIYRSDDSFTPKDLASADSTVDLFGFRPGRLIVADPRGFGFRANRESFTHPAPSAAGHWQLSIEHRLGSLDAAVDRLRLRNLAVSFAILLVLVGSVVMIIIASERARMLAKLQMKFAAGVSHELRTPLAAIQAMAYNLTAGVVKEPAHIEQYARMVLDEARGLAGMVDQVLLFAETQSKGKKHEVGPLEMVEVVEVLDQALAGLAAQIRETRCNIVTEISDDLPVIRADATALTHCLRNLVTNALKYGRNSSLSSIQISATHIPQYHEVQIKVIDSGAGIDVEDLPYIFTAFYRGRSAAPGIRGAGLGLYLVKRLMEAQRGRVTVDTNQGAGTTFTLHIPVFDRAPGDGPAAVSR